MDHDRITPISSVLGADVWLSGVRSTAAMHRDQLKSARNPITCSMLQNTVIRLFQHLFRRISLQLSSTMKRYCFQSPSSYREQ